MPTSIPVSGIHFEVQSLAENLLVLHFEFGLPVSLWLIGVWKLVYGVFPVVIVFLCLPLLTALASLGLLAFTVLAWKNHDWSFGARSHYSVITLATLESLVKVLWCLLITSI